MSIVCEHTSYMEQNFSRTHSSNNEQERKVFFMLSSHSTMGNGRGETLAVALKLFRPIHHPSTIPALFHCSKAASEDTL